VSNILFISSGVYTHLNTALCPFAEFLKATISFVMSVCLFVRLYAWNSWAPTRRIFMKFYIWVFFENLPSKFKLHWSLTKITGTLYEDQYIFLIISRSIVLRIKSVRDKNVENIKTRIHVRYSFSKIVPFMR